MVENDLAKTPVLEKYSHTHYTYPKQVINMIFFIYYVITDQINFFCKATPMVWFYFGGMLNVYLTKIYH
jgi:hypothetical protein